MDGIPVAEYRYWLLPTASVGGKVESQRSWFEVKADIELLDFPFGADAILTNKHCNRCGRPGHSSKRCIHDSQYIAYPYDDVIANKKTAEPIDIFDVIFEDTIIVLRRLPWLKAVEFYGKENMMKYAEYRESLMFSEEERSNVNERITSFTPKQKRTDRSSHVVSDSSPPQGYVCHSCNEPGHWRQQCPLHKTDATTPSVKKPKLY